jgi:deoxycytidylate deaminase
LIIQAGIKEINYMSKAHDTGWEESFKVSREMFDQAGVGMTFHGVV